MRLKKLGIEKMVKKEKHARHSDGFGIPQERVVESKKEGRAT
jgi:hypothetical protein